MSLLLFGEGFKPLPRLVVRGQFIQLDNGTLWTGIGATDFNLFGRFISGEDIKPILAQRASIGFNWLRVFTAYDVPHIGRLYPHEHPDYDAKFKQFVRLVASYGMYVELVAFAGHHWQLGTDDDVMVAHWERLIKLASEETNVTLELANELDNSANPPIPLDKLRQPPSPILASHGSNVQDHFPVTPLWSYATYRPDGGNEWHRKVGHNAMEDVASKYDIPTVSNETIRFPDDENEGYRAYDAAAGAALLCAGATFHSVHGKDSSLFVDTELSCAVMWVSGVKSVDLRFQDGLYSRSIDPVYLRIYHKTIDQETKTVYIHY